MLMHFSSIEKAWRALDIAGTPTADATATATAAVIAVEMYPLEHFVYPIEMF